MSSTTGRTTGTLLPVLAIALQATQVAAEPKQSEIETLKRQIHELQLRVDRLEGKMHEGMPVNLARKVEPLPGGWREPDNWKLLDKGMEKPRVIAILGEPQRRKTVKKFQYLTYGDGEVRLYLGRLSSWDAPSGIAGKTGAVPLR